MAEVIRMPKMSDTMEKGVIARWLKQVGDTVTSGAILAEVETDKATMELEAYEAGTLLYLAKQSEIPINGVLAIVGEPNEDISALLATLDEPSGDTTAASVAPTQPTPPATSVSCSAPPVLQGPGQRLFISPLAKKLAQEQGYDVTHIPGSGEKGRIIRRDIERFATSLPASVPPSPEKYHDVPVSSMRRTIAQRLTASQCSVPHFYLTIQVAMDQVVAARTHINHYAPVKISFNDIIIKATATALRKHPTINAAWQEEAIRYYQHIHLGLAVAIEGGILVPVLPFADQQSLAQLATAARLVYTKAQQKQLHPTDTQGATFTISNLGMLGIESFTAIVNPPAACILAIGEIKQVPVVQAGHIVAGYVMKATLSCDHRVVDGAEGATFLKTLKELLENPIKMLV